MSNKKPQGPKYQKEYEDLVVVLGKAGATDAIISDELGISTEQLIEWERTRKTFAEAMKRSRTSSRAFHERALMAAYSSKEGNPTLIQSLLKANFSDSYQNATYQGVGKGGNKKDEAVASIDFQAEIETLLNTLRSLDDEPKTNGRMVGRKAKE